MHACMHVCMQLSEGGKNKETRKKEKGKRNGSSTVDFFCFFGGAVVESEKVKK